MNDEICLISTVEAVTRLRKGEVSPLELVEASARRIADIPAIQVEYVRHGGILQMVLREMLAKAV